MTKTTLAKVAGTERRAASTWEALTVAVATVAGLALRLYRLGAAPLSSQEVYTWDFSHQSVPFILVRLPHMETNPPFYYLLMKGVTLLGDAEFLLRLPSVIAGSLAIPLVYLLGRVGGASAGGAVASVLLALSAVGITYSRDARVYAFAQDACLLAAIGMVIILKGYFGKRDASGEADPREATGWVLFTAASLLGFYLHYTFVVEIAALQAAFALVWMTAARFDKALLFRWLASAAALALGMSWGLMLARGQSQSPDIAWMTVPTLRDAAGLLIHVDGFGALSRFHPWPSLFLIGTAFVGLAAGWRRSAAVLVAGALFVLFPLLLLFISQSRPMFIERVLVPPTFAVCLLAGHGVLWLAGTARRSLAESGMFVRPGALAALAALTVLIPAAISAANSLRPAQVWEPYDKAAGYLAAAVKPGDVAAGADGIIYYRDRMGDEFPYYKIITGETSEGRVTFGSPTVNPGDVAKLARSDRSVYLVLRESMMLLIDGRLQSHAAYVLGHLGAEAAWVATFGKLDVYRLTGTCPASAPCIGAAAK